MKGGAMRVLRVWTLMVFLAPVAAMAQSGGVLDLSALDVLAASAEETVSISLDPATMDLARAFLGQHALEEDESALDVIEGLQSFQVRMFEFADEDAYSEDAIAPVYDQLRSANWSQILTINESGERMGAWIYRTGDAIEGLALVVSESGELVVVNLVGMIRLQDLETLASSFGLNLLP
jgi:hypothetical protein